LELGKLEDIGCADCSESEKGLEDESTTDGEGIVAAVVAALVEAVEFLEPTGGVGQEIADSGNVVGQDGADRTYEEKGKWNVTELGRTEQKEKEGEGEKLVGCSHGKEAEEFCFTIGCGVKPVADSRIAVGDGVEEKVAEDSGEENGNWAARDELGEGEARQEMNGGKHQAIFN